MDVKIRDARPNDSAFLSWLILTAGRAHVKRGIWEVILGEPEDECLKFLKLLTVTDRSHLFHYSCYLIAETRSGPVAGLGGYDPNVLGYEALRQILPEVYRKAGKFPSDEMAEGEPPRITTCIPPPVEGAWVIDSVATLPSFRRKGIVDRLLGEILDRGRKGGFRQTQVSIYIGNNPAQKAYEKHGFKLLDEWLDSYFETEISSPGMARLVRDL